MVTAAKNPKEEYQRTRLDNAINTAILAWTAPICVTWTASKYAKNAWRWFTQHPDGLLPVSKRKTVLITEHTECDSTVPKSSGASLHIIRALGKAGHRVIFVTINKFCGEEKGTVKVKSLINMFVTCYSKYVYKHYNVEVDPMASEYEQDHKCILEILSIAKKENVDWYIPMTADYGDKNNTLIGREFDWYAELSMGNSLLADVTVAKLLTNMLPKVKSFINSNNPYATRILSDRLYFLLECKRMKLNVPDFHLVESTAELRKLQREGVFSDPNQKYCIMAMQNSNQQNSNALRGIEYANPIATNTSIETFHDKSLGLPFQEGKPHLICQYIMGHPFIINVVCHRGSVLYIDIYGVGDNAKCFITEHLRQRFKDWVVEFCQAKKFDGLLNFDFLVEDSSEEVICVGVKPNLDLSIIKRHTPEEMKELERAIRLGLEADSIETIYSVSQSDIDISLETTEGGTTQENEMVRYRGTIQSQIKTSSIKSSGSVLVGDEMTYDVCATTQKKIDDLKPEQVYWIKDELDKWFDRRQGVTDLANILMNGKEANWDDDDPLPYTAAHLLQLPDLIRNTISPAQSSNEKGKEE